MKWYESFNYGNIFQRLKANEVFILPKLSVAPSIDEDGQLYFNTSTGKIYKSYSGSWIEIGSGSSSSVLTQVPITGDGTSGNEIKLNYNTDFVLDVSNKLSLNLDFTTLPSLSLSRNWTIWKSGLSAPFPSTTIGNGSSSVIVGTTSNIQDLLVPTGCVVLYSGTATVSAIGSGQQAPTSMSGDYTWSPNPPTSFPSTSNLGLTNLTSDRTITVTETKPKSGFIVSGSQVIRATGNDTNSASDSLTFKDLFYWGYTSSLGSGIISQSTANTITASAIQNLNNYRFGTKSQSFSGVNDSSGTRLVIAYKASAGDLSNIVLNSSTSILGAYLKRASDVTITTISGASVSMRVYIAVADNSYPGSNTLTTS